MDTVRLVVNHRKLLVVTQVIEEVLCPADLQVSWTISAASYSGASPPGAASLLTPSVALDRPSSSSARARGNAQKMGTP